MIAARPDSSCTLRGRLHLSRALFAGLHVAGELFAETIMAADVQAVTNAVNNVLKINKCVMDMGAAAREVCLDEVGQLQQSRRAVKEYSSNTG